MALDPLMTMLVVDDYNTVVPTTRHLSRQLGFSDVDDRPDATVALEKMYTKRCGLGIGSVRKDAGINNYIVKPFNSQTSTVKIEAVSAEMVKFTSPRER